MKRGWIKYLIALLVGCAIFSAILFGKGFTQLDSFKEKLGLLSDAFLVPGILLILFGCFTWIIRQGTFSGMGYTIKNIWTSLHSKEYRDEHKESYADYRQRRAEKKTPFLFLIITGAFFLIPSIAVTIIYTVI